MKTPEDLARIHIDELLRETGWLIQNLSTVNLSTGRGMAVREVPLSRDISRVDPARSTRHSSQRHARIRPIAPVTRALAFLEERRR